jgi:hypothetical protein
MGERNNDWDKDGFLFGGISSESEFAKTIRGDRDAYEAKLPLLRIFGPAVYNQCHSGFPDRFFRGPYDKSHRARTAFACRGLMEIVSLASKTPLDRIPEDAIKDKLTILQCPRPWYDAVQPEMLYWSRCHKRVGHSIDALKRAFPKAHITDQHVPEWTVKLPVPLNATGEVGVQGGSWWNLSHAQRDGTLDSNFGTRVDDLPTGDPNPVFRGCCAIMTMCDNAAPVVVSSKPVT